MPDDATFCPHCGKENKHAMPKDNPSGRVVNEKNMLTALVISFLLVNRYIHMHYFRCHWNITLVSKIVFGI